jgi:hypothetical protein
VDRSHSASTGRYVSWRPRRTRPLEVARRSWEGWVRMTTAATKVSVVGDLSTLIGDFERSLVGGEQDAADDPDLRGLGPGCPPRWRGIGREQIVVFAADQLARFKPATVSQRYRALAQPWKWPVEEGEVRDNRSPECARRRCPKARSR